MITIKAVLPYNGTNIVPVRAIPFVTGGDMSPTCLAGILSDPDHWFVAFVLGLNGAATQMLPKNWHQYKNQLTVIASGTNNLDLVNRTTIEALPASTFVYWESLWRTHEAIFLPSRETIYEAPPEEQADYELQPNAIIPKALIDLVFEGFSPLPKVKPISRAKAQDQEILSVLAANGIAAGNLPRNVPGKSGVKALVRNALGNDGMWSGSTVFDKAWERLLKNGDIVTPP